MPEGNGLSRVAALVTGRTGVRQTKGPTPSANRLGPHSAVALGQQIFRSITAATEASFIGRSTRCGAYLWA
jgi:hypothetical protein